MRTPHVGNAIKNHRLDTRVNRKIKLSELVVWRPMFSAMMVLQFYVDCRSQKPAAFDFCNQRKIEAPS